MLLLCDTGLNTKHRRRRRSASWNTSDSKTIPVPFRMAVDGGQVTIELHTVAPGVKFKGMITGTPI